MVWFRIDDGFANSPKVLAIPRARRLAAVGVWVLAGTWSARNLTDGFVPSFALDEVFGGKRYANDLVLVQLWERNGSDFQFHDWHKYQPSRVEVLQEREAHAARQKAYRERKQRERDAASDASRSEVRDASVTGARPDPTRPDPTSSSYGTTRSTTTGAPRRIREPAESTATRRLRATAAAMNDIIDARSNGHPPPQIGAP